MSDRQERLKNINQDHSIEISRSAAQRLDRLSKDGESQELSPDSSKNRTESARLEVMKTAISVETKGKISEASKDRSATLRYRGPIDDKRRDESYNRTLKHVQSELPLSSRLFSKFTHNKIVEKTSDIIGSTLARPNSMLSGAIFAFIFTLATYTVAKTTGYALSGFETIASFIAGWASGVIFDYLRILFTGKKF